MGCASFVFPAVKGYQAKREYYISMVPLGIIPRIFQFVDENLAPEIRAQRVLNKARIPGICNYILDNPNDYVFSAITVSVDGEMSFTPLQENEPQIGHIEIGMSSKFLINDGQHRQAAIAEALKKNPDLKDEHISVVFYRDEGLVRSQQMFSDLNRYAIRPTKSINILFNSREESALIAKRVIEDVPAFCGWTEKERSSVSNRSKALFTLSSINAATELLLKNIEKSVEDKTDLAVAFWKEVSSHIPQWNNVLNGNEKSSDVRKNYICTLSITLAAIGAAGNKLVAQFPGEWKEKIARLENVDWHKTSLIWKDIVVVNGRVATNRPSQLAMSTYIEKILFEEVGGTDA